MEVSYCDFFVFAFIDYCWSTTDTDDDRICSWQSESCGRGRKSKLSSQFSSLVHCVIVYYALCLFQICAEGIDKVRTVAALTKESWFEERYNAHFDELFK